MKRGKFITIEGGEGVGKTTNINFIRAQLDARNIECVVTREPGGTPLAEEIREVLIAPRDEQVCVETELLLMFAARAQHLHEKILPALERGAWVISDRFTDATYAYQSGGRGVPEEKVALLEDFVQGALRPDCTILLDAPPEVGMQRAQKRGELDRFEQERAEFFSRVRDNYLTRAKADPSRFKVINAAGDLDDVQRQISQVLAAL
ncbi:MAG: dTMP kinase [Oleiphilaceae bacterium]|nr:dTMP kinase [Oleiphilaceae bacterium]